MIRFYIFEYEVDVDEITFQAQCSYQHETAVEPVGRTAEDAVEQQDTRDGERDIEHSLQEEREHAMFLLLQEDTRQQRHQEHQPYHPYRGSVECLLLSYHLTHIDADEEDRHAAPEYLQMSHSLMYRGDILYQDAPNREKQVSGKFWDLEFTLNYAGMGGRGYTIDVMNVTDGTIQDQWVGDTYSDFLADFRELKNEYCDLYTDVDE